jgi:hypothetical protein
LGGAQFRGRQHNVCQEVPAVYIDHVFGLRVLLFGYSQTEDNRRYFLFLTPHIFPDDYEYQNVSLNYSLLQLLKIILKDKSELEFEEYLGKD